MRELLKVFPPHVGSINRKFQGFIKLPVFLGDLGTFCVRILFPHLPVFDSYGSRFLPFISLDVLMFNFHQNPHFFFVHFYEELQERIM